jgi:hypothetical protein
LPIFGEKIGVFSKTNVMINLFSKTSISLSKNANFFRQIFCRKIFLESAHQNAFPVEGCRFDQGIQVCRGQLGGVGEQEGVVGGAQEFGHFVLCAGKGNPVEPISLCWSFI